MKKIRGGKLVAAVLMMLAAVPVFGEGAGPEWEALYRQATELYKEGQYEQALGAAKQALEIAETNVGPDHPDVASRCCTAPKASTPWSSRCTSERW